MPKKPIDDKSSLVQVMAWCHQATSHYLSQCWPRSVLPYGLNLARLYVFDGDYGSFIRVHAVPIHACIVGHPVLWIYCAMLYVIFKLKLRKLLVLQWFKDQHKHNNIKWYKKIVKKLPVVLETSQSRAVGLAYVFEHGSYTSLNEIK